MKKYLLDSCAILSFLLAEKEGQKVKELLIDTNNQFFLNYINYGEIIFTLGKNNFDLSKLTTIKQLIKNALNIEFISTDNFEIIKTAAEYKILGGLSYFDALILASSKKYQLTIVTKDKEFQKFSKEYNILFL